MMDHITVRPEYKEIQIYGVSADQWNLFVDFYLGNTRDAQGRPIQGVRLWMLGIGVNLADVWTIILGDIVLVIFAIDVENSDWRTIDHLSEFLPKGFFRLRTEPTLCLP